MADVIKLDVKNICNKLQGIERRPKMCALEELLSYSQNPEVPLNHVFATFEECYLYLLKCYSDRFESIRELTIHTVTQFFKRLPANDFHLLNIIATLVERMGQKETIEESEELRLMYVNQLHNIIEQYEIVGKRKSLQESYADIVRILIKALKDPYPAVRREASACIVSLTQCADVGYFQQEAEQLAIPLYGTLNHKHSLVRISAIQALSRIALHINPNGDALTRLFVEVSPVLMDTMPLVRRECGELGILVCLELRDRYSYFDRIIPLILCCLKDESPDVIDYIRPMWVKCGKQYYEENEAELRKKEMSDIQPSNYPKDVLRPTIGCRGIVQRSLRLLQLITKESSDWKENVRLHSLKLLYQFILHAEAAMTAKFFEIYPEVAHACRDGEPSVAQEAFKVSDLMGRLLSYEDWREHAINGLQKNAKEGYLKCFYYMFNAAIGIKFKDIKQVSEILLCPDFSQTFKPEFQIYVIKLIEILLDKHDALLKEEDSLIVPMKQLSLDNNTNEELDKNIYITTIKVMALSMDSEESNVKDIQGKGIGILNKVAERLHVTLAELHEKYFSLALEYVEDLDTALDGLSEPILLFYGLLNIAMFRPSYMKLLQTKLNLVWQNCANDAKIKMFTAISIAMLQWNSTIGIELEESIELLREFLTSVVEQHFVWQAGAHAEAMRSLATATLCSMSQGAQKEAKHVLPLVAKYMTSLLEDHSVSTRHYAVKCMFYCGFSELSVEELKPIAYATLQRLDDPSSGIRELAAVAISKLNPKFIKEANKERDFERSSWEMFIKKAIDMLLLHYGGPEIRLQGAIKGTILHLADSYPELFKDSFKRVLAMSYGGSQLLELQNDLPFPI